MKHRFALGPLGAACPRHSNVQSVHPIEQWQKPKNERFAIISDFVTKLPLFMHCKISGLLRTLATGVLVALACGLWLSCYKAPSQGNGGGSGGNGLPPSGVRFRAFVSQDISSSTAAPGLDIVNATLDRLVRAPGVSISSAPTIMEVSSSKTTTLVFNATDSSVNVVKNSTESAIGSIRLPDVTESMALPSDASVAFAAVHNAPVPGGPLGTVEMLNLSNISREAPIPVPGVRFIVLSPDGTHLLAFSDNQDTVTIITLSNIGTSTVPNWTVSGPPIVLSGTGLDRPVWGVFSTDSTKAFVMDCGPQCGGVAAGVSVIDLSGTTPVLGATIPAPSATYGALSGTNLFVAGTAPTPVGTNSCSPTTTAATSCGQLSVIDISTQQLVHTQVITDGYHNHMAITSDGNVFVGSKGCTNVIIPNQEQRGCLSIYNVAQNSVFIGPDLGDVTGIAPVTGRPEVYVVENGELRTWNTTTTTLQPPNLQINIIGQAIDVKVVD